MGDIDLVSTAKLFGVPKAYEYIIFKKASSLILPI